jgi:hypothetical protein
MAELTQTLADILTATFGPATAAEAMKDEATEASGSSPDGADGSSTSLPPTSPATAADAEVGPSDLPHTSTADAADAEVVALPRWWKRNLDGTPRKMCQAPDVLKGVPQGETRQRETDLLVLKALHAGAETLVQVVASTGFVKVTCTRSLERLVLADRVLQSKAAPTGKRGRPAFTYRPTTEADVPVDIFGVKAALTLATGHKTSVTTKADADVAVGVEG